MNRLAIAALSFFSALLFGCAAPIDTQSSELMSHVAQTTLPSGWRVDCLNDHHKAERMCFAGSFSKGVQSVPFQVNYVNGDGPILVAGYHTFPGRYATIRVDSGRVLTVNRTDAENAKIVSALKTGKVAFLVYHVWPEGEERAEIDVSGFAEAHSILLRKLTLPPVNTAGLAKRSQPEPAASR